MHPRSNSRFCAIALIALISWTTACGSSSPAAPDLPLVTDNLQGTLSPTNANTHQLNSAGAGSLTVTLTSVTPTVPAVGMGIGVVTNGNCTLQFTNSPFTVGTVWNANVGGAGTFCIVIYDIGLLTQDVSYTITVVHP
ncbi:MAG TPA: hypothetical protein VJN96_16010 [Vicinamibacterales bacterium]|nr:hypothetical protein [Vicinamibacterales bacterium]